MAKGTKKIEGGGKPKDNKVWHDKGGKNFEWQPVDSPNKALTTAKSGYSPPGSKSYILGWVSEGTSFVQEGKGTSHWMSKDYNSWMRTAAYHAMKDAYKHFQKPAPPNTYFPRPDLSVNTPGKYGVDY
tara:strand:- start:5358 stop:5741 length:384 start_codon:yes stop_codon:yes gene_type:complete